MLWSACGGYLHDVVLPAAYVLIARRRASSSKAKQGLESGHRLLSPIIAKDKFIEVALQMIPADTMMSSNKPLLEVANRSVGQRYHRFRAFAHIRSQRLRACHVLEPSCLQTAEARQAVSVYRCTRGHVLRMEADQRFALEVWDNRHAAATGSTATSLHGHDNQRRFPAPELTASLQPRLRTPNPGLVHFHFAPQRLACQVDHGPPKLVQHHPRGFVPAESKLALKKERREPARIGGHQVGRPKPDHQRRFGVMKNGPGRQRYLAATDRTLPAPLFRQFIGTPLPASRTHKTIRPTTGDQILLAGLFSGKLQLKLSQSLWKPWARHPQYYPLCHAETTG